MRRLSSRPLLTLAASIALLATPTLAACGGDDSSDSDAAPEEVSETFVTAIANGDGSTACGVMSQSLTDQLEADGDSCEDAVGALSDQIPDENRDQVGDATYEVSDQTDTTATVEATLPDGSQTINLEQEDGSWKVK